MNEKIQIVTLVLVEDVDTRMIVEAGTSTEHSEATFRLQWTCGDLSISIASLRARDAEYATDIFADRFRKLLTP